MLVIEDLDEATVERAGALVAREHAAARQVRPELPAGFGGAGFCTAALQRLLGCAGLVVAFEPDERRQHARAARSPGAQVFDGRPEDTWACGPSRISVGSCDPALVGSPATCITYLTRARALDHARRSGRRYITAAVCVVTGPWLPDPRRVR